MSKDSPSADWVAYGREYMRGRAEMAQTLADAFPTVSINRGGVRYERPRFRLPKPPWHVRLRFAVERLLWWTATRLEDTHPGWRQRLPDDLTERL